MQIKGSHYPHPVLSDFSEALVDSLFDASFDTQVDGNMYRLRVDFTLVNEDLNTLIQKGKATYALHLECIGTRLRSLYRSREDNLVVEVPAQELDGRVEVCVFILASEDLEYTNRNFGEDYNGVTFFVQKGDVLAVGPEFRFVPPKDIDPLLKVPSIFAVQMNPHSDAPDLDVSLATPKVVILLSRKLFTDYQTLANVEEMKSVLATLIVLPALTYVLEEMNNDDMIDEYELQRWYQVLQDRLRELNLKGSGHSNLWVAQQLIGAPLSNALTDTKKLVMASGGGNE
ncbi:hypothetical protein CIG75_07300 [Tumebacillus algifaecis]|uniref:Uncharacterized protein n=1 Tax=Tumebacillus algifaecis TaxID=1214604 RepID=A0A223CZN2_9BACL|nr:hypothetical protein [Tumebacillus algifaecis]ASS74802.1 hypothetical protein CIG75_07300 [Tumebacillus algifaecis]